MISLHTNLSSLITQNNMNVSTTKANTAIERMSTGYKINHAGDNAANYSISRNMSVQLSACDVAADNISMGMDLLSTAQDTIAGMQARGSRIHALITQARNGTYGTDSLTAMTQEAAALVSEINRLYNNTEYNGIKLFDNIQLPDWAQEVKNTAGTINGKSLEQCALEHNGFIAEVDIDTPEITVSNASELEDAINNNTIIGIANADTLAELAKIVNGTDGYTTNSCDGKTIVLTNDIDLSDYHEGEGWTPIGTISNRFRGNFNGNGHKVTGLYINRNSQLQGLFGTAAGNFSNVGVEGFVKAGTNSAGMLVAFTYDANSTITNCHTSGYVEAVMGVGGLCGAACGNVYNSYSECDVYATSDDNSDVGGLFGHAEANVENCFATGNVKSNATNYSNAGGLVGNLFCDAKITNCHASGNVTSNGNDAGGLIGSILTDSEEVIVNSYATGNVSGKNYVGGLVGGFAFAMNINNCYATGNVSGENYVGGIIADEPWGEITNSFSACTVIGTGSNVGDFYGAGDEYLTDTSCGVFKYYTTSLQVGINSGEDSQIKTDTNLKLNLSITDLTSDSALDNITSFLNQLSEKSTQLGAAQNRLESALESNLVQMDNLTSSLSTIRDADISKVSSDYIRQQILQQACATLMSTANQNPAIALQLL